MSASDPKPVQQAADAIAQAVDADVIFVNAPIQRPLDDNLIELVRLRRKRKNVLLILVSEGGDADAAYRIGRCLQENYERFVFVCSGYCKSAATLVALGAHELVIAEVGELGPLDVQMTKADELVQMQSGLTATSALSTLHRQAFAAYEHFFLQTVRRGGNIISTRTATQIAVQLAVGLFAPLYQHVDPMHVGEAGRALQVAEKYGQLLGSYGRNLWSDALNQLTTGYPSHGFVIDKVQAEQLFNHVRRPNSTERTLIDVLDEAGHNPVQVSAGIYLAYLSSQVDGATEQTLPGLGQTVTGDFTDERANSEPVTPTVHERAQGGGAETPGRDTEEAQQRRPAEVRAISGTSGSRHR